ncbi:MAG: 30S ribosome-binding factor RbfA [Verrucomicrobia bacterium]|nr:MAG: 30S ribosome-binding factor RbfA [Verrucomicrobiota bacterium]
MGQRITRVNELVKREISLILHTQYRDETVYITITDVNVAPDLRTAQVFYSVLGDPIKTREAGQFFARYKTEIKRQLGKVVVLKYLPRLEFILDPSIERGIKLIDFMDELEPFDDQNSQDNQETQEN